MSDHDYDELKRLVGQIQAWQREMDNRLERYRETSVSGGMTKSVASKIEQLEKQDKEFEAKLNQSISVFGGRLDEWIPRVRELQGQPHQMTSSELVDLQVKSARADQRVQNQDKFNKQSHIIVGISACSLVVLEPLSFFVTNYVVSVILGTISIALIILGAVRHTNIQPRREALEEKAEADIRYFAALQERDSQNNVL